MRGSDRSKSSMRLRANLTALKLLDDIGVVFVVVVVVVVDDDVDIAFATPSSACYYASTTITSTHPSFHSQSHRFTRTSFITADSYHSFVAVIIIRL